MKKLFCEIFLKKNNFFLNYNSCLNYGTKKKASVKYILNYYTKCDYLKLKKFNYKNFSTLEKNKINEIKKDTNIKEYYYSKTIKIKENKLRNESCPKSENTLEECIEENEEISNDSMKGKKEKGKKTDLTQSLSEEYGYKYGKHEPTMFGDWSHNCRVTDF